MHGKLGRSAASELQSLELHPPPCNHTCLSLLFVTLFLQKKQGDADVCEEVGYIKMAFDCGVPMEEVRTLLEVQKLFLEIQKLKVEVELLNKDVL